MDTKALRQKILDLAIRGKLVPQDPNDEPASVLLERIRAEKQQMVKDGKLKAKEIKNDTVIFLGDDNLHYEKFPDGTVKCIQDEIPFELPQGWEWCRLSVYTAIMNGDRGKNYPSKDKLSKDNSGIPFISASDINNGYVVKDNMLYMSNKQYELLSAGKLKLGDIVFCIRGSLGKCGRFMFDNGAIASSLVIVRGFVDEESYFEYLYQYLLSPIIFDEIKKYDNGSAQPNLAAKDFMKFFVPVPPLAEQHRIVSKINELLSFVDIIESDKTDLQTTIQLTKSKILDLAIRGKLVKQNPDDEPASVLLDRIRAEKEELIKQGKIKRDKKESVIFRGEDNSYYEKIGDTVTCIDEELPFELPDGWIWCRGSSCFLPMESRKPSGTYFKYIDIDSIDNKHQAIKKAKITETAKAPSRANRAVFDGSILFSLVRPYLKNIALVDSNNADSIVSTGFYIATSNGTFIPKYLYILMISAYVVNGLNQFMKGDNSPSISKDNIEKWLYPVPPLAEQEKIADIVQKYIRILEDIEKSLS